jgi:hypothetical protein
MIIDGYNRRQEDEVATKKTTQKSRERNMNNFATSESAFGCLNNTGTPDFFGRTFLTKKTDSKAKNPPITYSSVELTDEQVKAMWAAHPGIENDEVIESL